MLSGLALHALLLFSSTVLSSATLPPSPYADGTASFSLGANAGAATGSACGYGNQFMDGFGDFRASASSALFSGGSLCGACFQIMCNDKANPKICRKGVTVNLTVTDQCLPAPFRGPSDPCDAKAKHFVLPEYIYSLIGQPTPGMALPIRFRRVACQRDGGIVFQVNGNLQMLQVNIRNVAGPGTVGKVWIKARGTAGWKAMQRSWGENWVVAGSFVRRILSFKLFSPATNQTVVARGVVPKNWVFGGKYSAAQF